MKFSLNILSTANWKARAPLAKANLTEPEFIVIHHTATLPIADHSLRGAKELARLFQNEHMDENSWDDSGHNFLITAGGVILEGRHGSIEATNMGRCIRSAHAGSEVGNRCPGIEIEGIFTNGAMPKIQWDSLVALCADLCYMCKINPLNIKGHRDFAATECPGDWLYSQLPNLISAVAGPPSGSRPLIEP